ncbi:MAG: hypothetical protein ACK5B9_13240 [Flavobacteriia bacterium]
MEKPIKNRKAINYLLILLIVGLIALVPFVFYNEFKQTILPLFLDFAAHHYFIVAFVLLMLILFIVRYSFKKKGTLTNESTVEESLSQKSRPIKNIEIEKIIFSEVDVLADNDSKNKRMKEILLSLRLGLLFRKRVTIFFKDFTNNLKISDLIIKKKDGKIMLKGGGFIPIRSIYKIEVSK